MLTLRFTGGGLGLAGQLVQLATWSWCSHVEVEWGQDLVLGAHPDHGVAVTTAAAPRRLERYTLDLPLHAEARILEALESQIGRPYDWSGIWGWGLRRDWQDPAAWFCSELVAWACAKAGHPLLRAERAWRVSPRDLLMSPLLVPVVRTKRKGLLNLRSTTP